MQTQHISDIYPNIISISKIREDIDSLLILLEKYGEVKVLRGQKILFTVSGYKTKQNRAEKIGKAIRFADRMAKKYKVKKGEISGSEWIIREREKMRNKSYYE